MYARNDFLQFFNKKFFADETGFHSAITNQFYEEHRCLVKNLPPLLEVFQALCSLSANSYTSFDLKFHSKYTMIHSKLQN